MKTSSLLAFLFAGTLFLTGYQAFADPSLTSDKLDYMPGETATFTGSGFQPGENVELIVVHADTIESTGEDHGSWVVAADEQGSFVTTWHVCTDDCAGSTLRAAADGVLSGLHAECVFTDAPVPAFVTVTASPSCALGGTFRITYKPPTGNNETVTSTTPHTFEVKTNSDFTVTLIQGSVNGTSYAGAATLNGSSGGDNTTTTVTLSYSDGTPPTIVAPPAVNASTGAGATACGTVVSNATLGSASASDNCGTPSVVRTGVPAGNVFPVGTTVVTYTATDGGGLHASATQNVVVTDTTPPVLALNGATPMTVECHSPFSDPGASASDACAGDLTGSIQVSGSVDPNTPGSYTLTYSVSDGFNSSSLQRTVNVVDTTAPSLALNGATPMTVECHSPFSDPGATASDACAGDLTGSIQVSGSVDPNTPGSYTLTYSVSDGFNSSSAQRTVNVVDTIAPSLALNGATPMTVECHSPFSDPGASASDACAGDLTGSIQVSGSVDPNTPGSYTLTYSVSDGFNSSSLQRTVNVVDTTAPSLALNGATPMTVECHSPFSDPGASASDACAGDLTGSIQVSGSVDPNTPGSYTLTYSVSDGFNSSSLQRTVNVVDTTAPSLALNGATPMTVECHSPFSDPGASASDACAGDLTGSIQVSGSVDPNTPGSYTLTYSVSDGFNSSSLQRIVNVVDTTAPSLALNGATPMTVECHSPFSDPGASASDACAGDLTGSIQVSGPVDPNTPGSYTLTYSVSDGFNSSSLQRTVNVVDTTAPSLALNGATPMTVECHSPFSDPGASASDACAGDLTGSIQVSGSVDPNTPGSYTLTYSVSDGFNSSSLQRIVNVVDTTAPSLALNGATPMTVECHSPFSDPGASASDACAGDLTGSIQVSGSVDPNTPGSYTLTYSVSDGFNSSSLQRTVNVVDTTAPSLALNGATPMTVECHSPFSDPGASASDACAGDLTGSIQVSGSVDPNTPGSYTLTYSVSDGFNSSSLQRTVNVVDTTAPSLALNGATPMTVECHSPFSDPGASASDACAGDLTGSIQVSGSVDPNTPGSYTLTYSVSDGFNSSSLQRTVNVVDTTAPSLSVPVAIHLATGASATTCGLVISDADLGAASASDACAGPLSVTRSGVPAGNLFPAGTTVLSYSVMDGNGNHSEGTQDVTVTDGTPPALTVPTAVSAVTGPGNTGCSVVVPEAALGQAQAQDNCSSVTIVRTGVPAGNLFPVGTTTLSFTATDGTGNVSIGTQAVTVVDNTPPVFGAMSNVVRLPDLGSCSGTVDFIPTATDNCSNVTVVTSPPSGFSFPLGTTVVTCTATDAAGNHAVSTFSVMIQNPAPSVTITGPASGSIFPVDTPVAVSGSFSDNSGDAHTAQWTFDGVTASGTVNETSKTVAGTYTFDAPGIYFISLSVTDQCGGTGTASQVSSFSAMVVVYDPSAGFVTGGGWIKSPIGSYAANPSLAGRANFGFVSKYAKGASVPTGETEFQFQVGNLNFHSTIYDWLVVSGAKAQFKGSGTINGTGSYGFQLSAVDGDMQGGGEDKFRIKIINKLGGGVVYDNQMGAPDSTTAATVISGGSIVIHSPGKGKNGSTGAAVDMSPIAPMGFLLAQNSPNPFHGATQVRFRLPEPSRVELGVYDIAGREVAKLAAGEWAAGDHTVTWSGRTQDGNAAHGGVYFVRLIAMPERSSPYTATRKMLLLN